MRTEIELAADKWVSQCETNSKYPGGHYPLVYDSFYAGAEWAAKSGYDRNKLVVWGTDGCKNCECGRITLFAEKHGLCIQCYNAEKKESL